MEETFINRHIICIDLKSFFASCECVERGLDPFTYPLIVANPNQKGGAITLAVTPFLKAQGVPSRGRVFEISKDIKYTLVPPRMNLYIKKSKEVVDIYLDFVAKEDLHIYSIDECFLDLTHYLKLYKKTDYEIAVDILNTIKRKTGLTATCGIGPNMLLAKVAMDTEAKHNKDCIAKWTYEDVPSKLWPITPLSNMWGIGKNMERNLNKLNIYSMGELAKYDRNKLKDKFGVMGIELWNHANGIDTSLISDFNSIPKDKSYSHSQVLFKDYNEENIQIIIDEMVEVICSRLRKNNRQCNAVGFGIGYSKDVNGGFYHRIKLDAPTDSFKEINKYCHIIFDKFYEFLPIRKVTVCCAEITKKEGVQLNIFETYEEIKEEANINKAVDEIKEKYGKNSMLKASSLLKDSTIVERNKKVGGHNA